MTHWREREREWVGLSWNYWQILINLINFRGASIPNTRKWCELNWGFKTLIYAFPIIYSLNVPRLIWKMAKKPSTDEDSSRKLNPIHLHDSKFCVKTWTFPHESHHRNASNFGNLELSPLNQTQTFHSSQCFQKCFDLIVCNTIDDIDIAMYRLISLTVRTNSTQNSSFLLLCVTFSWWL